ncbi:hypothetical protein VaNZ11_011116 [Volvox africanus]|uniref:Cytochrome P450 n=1 Tax=Volvox africanus TaxID=51714 RepID=A0ABQ5SC48_9CHLO|nr:hypothetical protein VaNZ11_011116 [Volvox africanus]
MLQLDPSVILSLCQALSILALLLILLGLDLDKRWRLHHIPGPPALPFLGSLPQIIKNGSPTFFKQCRTKYGPVFRVAFGRNWVVVVTDPELMRQVGIRRLNRLAFRSLMRGDFARIDDWGLVMARDDYWRLVRNAWQPAFSPASLSGYLPRMVDCAVQLVKRLEKRAVEGGEAARVDIWRELESMTLQVVGSTAYGVDFHAMDSSDDSASVAAATAADTAAATAALTAADAASGRQYGHMLTKACHDFFRHSNMIYGSKYSSVSLLLPELRPLLSTLAHALPDLPFLKLLRARKQLYDDCISLIDNWKAAAAVPTSAAAAMEGLAGGNAAATKAAAVVAPAAPNVAVGSFLGLILSARDKSSGDVLSDLQVTAQVQTFILAGYETTANGLAFAVYCVATNPEVESRLLEEIDSVLGSERAPTEEDLPRLPYTEAVFNEAMRLYPPAHVTSRFENTAVQVGNFTVPPQTPIFLSIFSSHHNPDIWPRAEEFIPERFMPDSPRYAEVCARVPYAHSPFGYGSRTCIGFKFALQEAKVALARMYQRLRFQLEPGQVPLKTMVGLTLSPRNGVWVRPVLRHSRRE